MSYFVLPSMLFTIYIKDVNEYSNIQIFAFHSNIRIRFPNSNIRFFPFFPLCSIRLLSFQMKINRPVS